MRYCAAPSCCRPSRAVRRPGLISSALRKSAIAPAPRIRRRDPGRLAVVGVLELLDIPVDVAAIDIGKHIRLELDLHGVVGDRMRHVALAVIDIAAIAVGDGERRIVFDGGVEIGQRAIKVAFLEEGVAAVVGAVAVLTQVCQFRSPSADAAGGCASVKAPSSHAARQVKMRMSVIQAVDFSHGRRFASPGSRA